MYLVCNHCKCEFLASIGQEKRKRAHAAAVNFYCSAICQLAGTAASRRRPFPYNATCPKCGVEFGSRFPKKFCSLRCYKTSNQFLAMLRANASKALSASVLIRTGEEIQPRVEVTCINCGVKRIMKHCYRDQRFCHRRCYRQYMNKRFDRWIASPEAIALPQCYDEFLSRTELPCLIDGCTWVGVHLGSHVNFSHGISAREFKRAAGFNVTSGLVTPALSEKISARPHLFGGIPGGQPITSETRPPAPIRGYVSKESREHQAKARALLHATAMAPRVCQRCGSDYVPNDGGWGAKFCTPECRDTFYQENIAAFREWMVCENCGKPFQGTFYQHRRVEGGHAVACSMKCRNTRNGKAPKPLLRKHLPPTAEGPQLNP